MLSVRNHYREFCLARVVSITFLALLAGGLRCATVSLAAEGESCPNEALRQESNINPLTLNPYSTELPDCRAYELISPPYTQGAPVSPLSGLSGSHVIVSSVTGAFAGTENSLGLQGGVYELSRTPSGWEASAIAPPAEWFPGGVFVDASPGFARTLWQLRRSYQGVNGGAFYLREPANTLPGPCPAESLAANNCFVEIGPVFPPSLTETEPPNPVGVAGNLLGVHSVGDSADLSHVLFSIHSRLLTDSAGAETSAFWPGDTTVTVGGTQSLYEYSGFGNAEPVLVGVSNARSLREEARLKGVAHVNEAAELISECGTLLGSNRSRYNAVSASGETVFFTAQRCSGAQPVVSELYARIGASGTVALSSPVEPLVQGSGEGPEECDSTCQTAAWQEGVFQGASEDGGKVFFLSSQPLLNGDKDTEQDLYEEEITNGAIGRVIQVSHDPHTGQAAEVQGVARVCEDGSHVYFVAKGELASNQNANREDAVAGANNLYVYERDAKHPSGQITFIATLSPSDSADWKPSDSRPVQATPDGEFLVFQSVADLTADDTSEAVSQVFEYDAGTGELVRVSQGQDGFNENGNTNVDPATIRAPGFSGAAMNNTAAAELLAVSEDGSYVVFESTDALTPAAAPGQHDAYEYHWTPGAGLSSGAVSLLANGFGEYLTNEETEYRPAPSVSASGGDVLFSTPAQLVAQHTSTQLALYDARMNRVLPDGEEELAGFPAPLFPPECSGEACLGAGGTPPSVPTAESTGPPAVGNLNPGPAVFPTPESNKPKQKARRRRTRKLAKALKRCAGKHNKRKRRSCKKRARHRYGHKKKGHR
jgi:hypothetical protein